MRFTAKLLTTLLLGLALLCPGYAATLSVTGSGQLDVGHVASAPVGPITVLFGTFSFDSSYPTGGESFDITAYLNRGILLVSMPGKAGYVFTYDATNKKMLAYQSDDAVDPLDQVSDTTNLSSVTSVPFVAFGFGF